MGTVSGLEIPEEPDVSVIQFGQQKDDNGQKLGAIYFQPYDENDDPLAIMWYRDEVHPPRSPRLCR